MIRSSSKKKAMFRKYDLIYFTIGEIESDIAASSMEQASSISSGSSSSKKRKSDDKEQHNTMRFKMVKEVQNLNKRMDLAMKMELESKKFDIMTLIETNTNASEGIKKIWNERKEEIQKQIDAINEKLE